MGERLVYTQKVVGSSPASPINIYGIKVLKPVIENRLFLFLKACKNTGAIYKIKIVLIRSRAFTVKLVIPVVFHLKYSVLPVTLWVWS